MPPTPTPSSKPTSPFHLSIATATGNAVLSNTLGGIATLLRVWIRNVVDTAKSREPSYLQHVPIYEAIVAQDSAAAAAAMASHMEAATCRLKAALAETARTAKRQQADRSLHNLGGPPLCPGAVMSALVLKDRQRCPPTPHRRLSNRCRTQHIQRRIKLR
jgi:hypothetical protein